MTKSIVVADVGGTHVRFAIARLEAAVPEISDPTTLKTADFASFDEAWRTFAASVSEAVPAELAMAFAGSVNAETLRLTNRGWTIRRDRLRQDLGLERLVIVNDFGAVAHALTALDERHFRQLCGPEGPLPEQGVITVVGPGTGLGVAAVLRRDGSYQVIETEGGHIGFAPLDDVEEDILHRLLPSFGRVSVERLVSGSGLLNIHRALAAAAGRDDPFADEKALWTAALSDSDPLAGEALERFCLILGAAAGDFALAHGAQAVVIAGGLGLRLAERLPRSGFAERFVAKGRFRAMMEAITVKLLVHPQPGLLGAAVAAATHFSAER